jgi:hypothetical protein
MKILALTILPLALFSMPAAFAASDGVPTFNVQPSCRAAADASKVNNRLQACLDSEKKAREQIVNQWTQFTPAVRSECLRASQVGGMPTYTELITCLEMTRDVKKNPADESMRVTSADGNGPKTAIERAKGH